MMRSNIASTASHALRGVRLRALRACDDVVLSLDNLADLVDSVGTLGCLASSSSS